MSHYGVFQWLNGWVGFFCNLLVNLQKMLVAKKLLFVNCLWEKPTAYT